MTPDPPHSPDSYASLDFTRLDILDVSRHFGRRRALNQVSFTCEAGEVVGLLGPNGAGKSTLLAILATLLAPSSGEVRYGSHNAKAGSGALRRQIGLLAHDLHLYGELTARENLEFFARLYGLPSARARAAQALDRAGLGERGDEDVGTFSRGMRQRIALERALLHEPRLLLLDEPFSGLDARWTASLVDRLRALGASGVIMLVATHDLERARSFVDRLVRLRDGRVESIESLTH